MVPGATQLGGAKIRKTIFTCVYIEKNLLLQNQQAKFNQTWYKLCWGHGNYKLFKLRARSPSKGDNYKNGVGSFKNLLLQNHS
jgi:hypothetical protein